MRLLVLYDVWRLYMYLDGSNIDGCLKEATSDPYKVKTLVSSLFHLMSFDIQARKWGHQICHAPWVRQITPTSCICILAGIYRIFTGENPSLGFSNPSVYSNIK